MASQGAYVLGLISILLLTPLASKAVLMLPLQPYELAVGLAVFCCMPTSLSANIALTGVRLQLTIPQIPVASFPVPIVNTDTSST